MKHDCDDIDENCTVKVTRPSGETEPDTPELWETAFDDTVCSEGSSVNNNSSEGAQNLAFEGCWVDANYKVEWPIINLGRRYKFDITPHCDGNDYECAVELQICYNPRDCDPADEFWQ